MKNKKQKSERLKKLELLFLETDNRLKQAKIKAFLMIFLYKCVSSDEDSKSHVEQTTDLIMSLFPEPVTEEQTCYLATSLTNENESICVIAKNIADAFDKLEAQGIEDYEIRPRSYEIIQ